MKSSNDHSWIHEFFSPPNKILWSDLDKNNYSTEVKPWFDLVDSGKLDLPIILPSIDAENTLFWYGTSSSTKGTHQLFDELNAWFGPSYLIQIEKCRSDDVLSNILNKKFNNVVFRFCANPRDENSIRGMIVDYQKIILRRPVGASRVKSTFGKIRSEFDKSLLSGEENKAQKLFDELKTSSRLSIENIKFLEIRLNAGLGNWRYITDNRNLLDILKDLELPPQTIADIIGSLYRIFIEPFEITMPINDLVKIFKTNISDKYTGFFATRRNVNDLYVLKSFLLHELSQSKPNKNLCSQIFLELTDSEKESSLAQKLKYLISNLNETSVDEIEMEAKEAHLEGQYDRAFSLYLLVPPTKAIVSKIIYCASKIATRQISLKTLEYCSSVGTEIIEQLDNKTRQYFHEISIRANSPKQKSFENWFAWAEMISNHSEPDAEITFEPKDGRNWSITEFAEDKLVSDRFAKIFEDIIYKNKIISSVVPILFESFVKNSPPNSNLKSIYISIMTLIVLEDSISSTELILIYEITSHLLEIQLNSSDYKELVGNLGEIFDTSGALHSLYWAFDICELLVIKPCPNSSGREVRFNFFMKVISLCQKLSHRLKNEHFIIIKKLALDFEIDTGQIDGLLNVDTKIEADPNNSTLKQRIIGIYSLEKNACSRAKDILQELYSDVRVIINSDTVCTQSLKHLAKISDILIFAWRSSSHQAYYCVKDTPPKSELYYSAGKGSASIVRRVVEISES